MEICREKSMERKRKTERARTFPNLLKRGELRALDAECRMLQGSQRILLSIHHVGTLVMVDCRDGWGAPHSNVSGKRWAGSLLTSLPLSLPPSPALSLPPPLSRSLPPLSLDRSEQEGRPREAESAAVKGAMTRHASTIRLPSCTAHVPSF